MCTTISLQETIIFIQVDSLDVGLIFWNYGLFSPSIVIVQQKPGLTLTL